MLASVSTRVVSWNDAAEMNESVESDAFVMPSSSGRPCAGRPPSPITRSFSSRNRNLSTCSSTRHSVSPTSSTLTPSLAAAPPPPPPPRPPAVANHPLVLLEEPELVHLLVHQELRVPHILDLD